MHNDYDTEDYMQDEHDDGIVLKRCYVKMGDKLHEKLDKHISVIKHTKPGKISRADWLIEAFEEMLIEESNNTDYCIPKDKKISFLLNSNFLKKIDKLINNQKKFRTSYSRTKWFVEAIQRKLDQEDGVIKKLREEIENSIE